MTSRKIQLPLAVGSSVLVLTISLTGALLGVNNHSLTDSTSLNNLQIFKVKDGTYKKEIGYNTPYGIAKMDIQIEIINGIIKSIQIIPKAKHFISQRYQQRFAEGISGVVVGKRIDTLAVDKVNGASITTKAFNEALQRI